MTNDVLLSGPDRTVGALEEQLELARKDVIAARAAINKAAGLVNRWEEVLRQQWRRRRAGIDSLRLTERATRRSGLANSGSTRLSLEILRRRVDEATSEMRRIHQDAAPSCDAYAAAWELLRSARAKEATALLALSQFEMASASLAKQFEPKRLRAGRELALLNETRKQEEAEQQSAMSQATDEHYDPQYDEWEVVLRRSRPWV